MPDILPVAVNAPDCAERRSRFAFSALPSGLLRSLVVVLPFALSVPVRADSLETVHLRIAGREVTGRNAPVANDHEVYVPLDALKQLGMEGRLDRREDTVLLTWDKGTRAEEIAVARPNGKPMVALSDIARLVNGVIERPDLIGRYGKYASGKPGPNVYLLARITDARFEDGAIRVTTSFPVPFHVRTIASDRPRRGFVDCVGAIADTSFHPQPVAWSEKRAMRLRTGRNDVQTGRIVVELAEGVTLQASDSESNTSSVTIVAGVTGTPHPTSIARNTGQSRNSSGQGRHGDLPQHRTPKTGSGIPFDQGDPPPEVADNGNPPRVPNGSDEGEGGNPDVPANRDPEDTGMPANGGIKTRPVPPVIVRGTKPSRGGIVRQMPTVAVRALTFLPDSATHARLNIATTGRAKPFVRYQPDSNQLIVDVPNARLGLIEPAGSEQTLTHPLVSAVHAQLVQDAPPVTRITLDMPRIAGFTVNTQDDKISLELRLPRNATGVLADKVIVVDAGHGGSSTGALGKGGGAIVYEKNCTLGIALKLRAALEECGAKVVMSRDRDTDVPLYDRPRLANSINADLFISIHNDSNGVPNSASGTSTYYHMSDASCRALAACVQQAVIAVSGLPSRGVLSDGIMYAHGFAVLREAKMPAVLCEVAYINNSRDRSHLTNDDFQKRVAKAMCDGLRAYVEGNPQAMRTARRSVPRDPENGGIITQSRTNPDRDISGDADEQARH